MTAVTPESLRWQDSAACSDPAVDPLLFFGPEGEADPARLAREARAKAVCTACPVRRDCLAWTLALAPAQGIWGGLNEAERTAWRRWELRRIRTARARGEDAA